VTGAPLWCRHCDEPLLQDPATWRAVHAATMDEHCADGKGVAAVSAVDPAKRDEAKAITEDYRKAHPDLRVAWTYTQFEAWMQGDETWGQVAALTGPEMRSALDARLAVHHQRLRAAQGSDAGGNSHGRVAARCVPGVAVPRRAPPTASSRHSCPPGRSPRWPCSAPRKSGFARSTRKPWRRAAARAGGGVIAARAAVRAPAAAELGAPEDPRRLSRVDGGVRSPSVAEAAVALGDGQAHAIRSLLERMTPAMRLRAAAVVLAAAARAQPWPLRCRR